MRTLPRGAILLLAVAGCSSAPEGFLGVDWGEPPAVLEALGMFCDEWEPWAGGEGFEVCTDGAVAALGHPAGAAAIRRGDAVEGFEVRFAHCSAYRDDLVDGLSEELGVEAGVTYQVWETGEAVHLQDVGSECTLTVAGPSFGRAYQQWQLARGLGGLRLGP